MDLTLAAVPTDDAGAASGVFNTFQQVGYVLGVAVVGVVFFGMLGTDQSPGQYKDAIVAGTWVTAAFLAAAAAGLALPNRSRGPGRRNRGHPIRETPARDAASEPTPC